MKVHIQIDKKHSSVILGLTLRYARLKSGYSLRDMGELANISHTLIGNVETGKTTASPETLHDLFVILGINYVDNDELITEFTRIYKRVFINLFSYHYDRVVDDMIYLEKNEQLYMNSIVMMDYSLLRYLHGVLTNKMTPYILENLDLLRHISSLLTPSQQQLQHLIVGVDYYNLELYHDAIVELNKALKLGDPQYYPLINLYIIRAQVKMYMFMDAYKNAVKTIEQFDGYLYYHRSMQVRLELAYAYALQHKFGQMNVLLDKVLLYATEYQQIEFMDASYSIRSMSYYHSSEFDKMQYYIGLVKKDSSLSISIKMLLAYIHGTSSDIPKLYSEYIKTIPKRNIKETACYFNLLMYQFQVVQFSDEDYLVLLECLVEFGLKSHNQELLGYGFNQMIEFYQKKRLYKKALQLSEQARKIRNEGFLS